MMRIHNIRTGFAANSSSTHGMLHAPGMQDHLVEDGRFGWENFVAASPEAKARWLACHLIATARETCGDEAARAMALAWLGFEPSLEDYVDHQSLVRLPKDWGGKGVDSRFFAEFRDFVLQEGIVVLGGNDNYDEDSPPQLCGGIDYRDVLPVDTSAEYVGRRDSRGWWALFSRRDGTKLRVSFDHDIQKVDAEKSDVPELVDVKLTNYCTRGCAFCLDPNTLVLKADMTWVPLGTLKEDDVLVGFDEFPPMNIKNRQLHRTLVERKWSRKRPGIRVTTDRGEVICSPEHKFLMAHTHRWLAAKDLKLGHPIMFVDAPWPSPHFSERYMRGYISGLSCGDGSARWRPLSDARQVWWSIRLKDREPLDRAQKYVKELLNIPVEVKHQPNGMWRFEVRAQDALARLEPVVLLEETATDTEYQSGWLAGFFDAEGSYFNVLRLHQKSTDLFLDVAQEFLTALGLQSTKVPGQEVRIQNGRVGAMKFLGMTQPTLLRKYGSVFNGGINGRRATVIKLETLDELELVDIQTTTRTFIAQGMMTHNCYQGSTPQGRHADVDDVWRLAEVLREMRVFEVALGGGEPAEHPKFIEILKTFQGAGVVPNFTTRKLDWLWDPSQRLQILPLIGGWAFSAELPGAVRDLAAELSMVPHNKRPHIQYIVGVQDQHGFETMVRVCVETRLRLVLLGPKTTGRGSAATWHKVDWIPTVMRAIRDGLDVGIDTVLAAAYQSELVAAGVPSWCYTTQEGKFSMYVDLVEHRMGPSSYAPEGVVPLPRFGCDWRAGITEQFQGW